MEVQQCMQLTDTNRPTGLLHSPHTSDRPVQNTAKIARHPNVPTHSHRQSGQRPFQDIHPNGLKQAEGR